MHNDMHERIVSESSSDGFGGCDVHMYAGWFLTTFYGRSNGLTGT